jgi:2-polyprenyl-3-methyl-5-hydroxy-6-metoxy-1,4-benzoquinol methylase
MDDPRETVRQGYAQGRYAEEFRQRDSLTEFEGAWFDRFTDHVPVDGHILDLGCGTGVPYDRTLVDRGFELTGVDFTEKHIEAARENVPEATYLLGDISEFEADCTFDGLICLYTLFHLPKAEHPAMIERMARLLRPGSPLLLTTGAAEGDSSEENWCGGPMTWSSLDPDNYRDLLADSGFDLLAAEYEGSPDAAEYHWWALARRGRH